MDQTSDPLIGKRIGNYVIEAALGSGGMGTVYLAVHPAMGKRVAVKVLKRELVGDRSALGRLIDEARAATSIGHENIVEIFDFGETPEGMAYVVLELLVGETLHALLERQVRMDPRRAVRIARQVCAALGATHRRGIIHRDIKPQNVFLLRGSDGEDRVKLLDFGVAKLLDEVQRASPATATGALVGTPHYMSPEQARGEPVDARTDIWALGVVLYRALTGVQPFEGTAFTEVLANILTERVPPFSARIPPVEAPPALERVVLRALSKEPAERQPDAETLERELVAAVSDEAKGARAPDAVPLSGERPPSSTALGTAADVSPASDDSKGLAAAAVATADGLVRRRMLYLRLLLYPSLVALLLLAYWLLLRSGVVDRRVALELPLVGLALLPVAYLLEAGFHLTQEHNRDPRPLYLVLVALFVLGCTYTAQLNGTLTNCMAMCYVIVIAFVRLRLDRGAALFATVLAIVSYTAVVALEQQGVIPYARLLHGLYASTINREPGFAVVTVMGVVAFLILTYLGAHVLVRGLEQREEALTEVTRGLEGQVVEQIEILHRREQLRRFLSEPVVEAVLQGENDVKVGFTRLKVALVVCELVDYFDGVAHLEPEDQARILNEFFGMVSAAAQRAGAVVDAFNGPSVMLFTGAPRGNGERGDAVRAVRAARSLLQRVEDVSSGWQALGAERVQARAVVHAGYAAVGNFGSDLRLQYTALGVARALAESAVGAVPPRTVAVTQAARALCGDAFSFEPCGEVRASAGAEPVALYRVTGG
jgi:class 3 adenylate cyclase/tRNA A-37 threonylcarbamoyl transferase component Bud32